MNYADLKSDVAAWFIDEDLTSVIPSFVRLCEAEIRRRVRIRAMEQTTTIDVSSRSTALPTGFLSLRSLSRQGDDRVIEYMTPEKIREGSSWDASDGIEAFSIEGDNLIVAPAPSTTVTLDIVYLKAFDALSGDEDTNWLLDNAYDVYLFGTLEQAAVYAEDDQLELKYANRFGRIIEDLNREQKLSRIGGSSRVRRGVDTP